MHETDRRDQERIRIPGELRGEVMVSQPMTIIEISSGGALIETAVPLPLGSAHDLRLDAGSTSLAVTARIVHSRISQIGEGHLTYRSGVEFIQPSPAVTQTISSFVEALRATPSE